MPKTDDCSVRVVGRFRPINKREVDAGNVGVENFKKIDTVNQIITDRTGKKFSLDAVFDGDSTQPQLFDAVVSGAVKDIFEGINGTVFAYGQTGSGKSFTMFGKEHTEDPMLQGVIPRAATAIFEYCNASKENRTLEGGAENPANNVKSFEVKASYLEIYMGHVNDLLDPRKKDLKVHFDLRSKRGVWVEDLTECWVGSTEEIMDKIKIGDSNRHVSKTAMNEASSRSHSVFFIEVKQELKDGRSLSGKLCLADLAGSEKVSRSQVQGVAYEEACAINQSLSALNNCLHALTEGKSGSHLYRASKLTMILAESLGGNSKTTLMIAMSPAADSYDETVNTLRFAERAKTLKNKVRKNQVMSVDALQALVEELQAKVAAQNKYIAALEEALTAKGGDPKAVAKKAGVSTGPTATGADDDDFGGNSTGGAMDSAEKEDLMQSIQELQDQVDKLSGELNSEKATKDQLQTTLHEQIEAAHGETQKYKEEAESDHGMLSEMKKKYKELKDKANETEKKMEAAESEASELKENLAAEIAARGDIGKESASKDDEIQAWKQAVHKKQQQFVEIQKQLSDAKNENSQLNIDKQKAESQVEAEHESNSTMAAELNEWKVQVKTTQDGRDQARAKAEDLEKQLNNLQAELQRAQNNSASLTDERDSVRSQNESLSAQVVDLQTKLVGFEHTSSSNDEMVNQISLLTNENTKLKHENERLEAVVQRNKDTKQQSVEECMQMRQQLLDEQAVTSKLKMEGEQAKSEIASKDDQIKDLKEQTERLSAKIREEMQSVKYWMNDHKQLTEELDEEHDTHRKTMARMEERVADLDDQLKEAWAGRRDAAQSLRDKERENKHLQKQLAKYEQDLTASTAKMDQCEQREDMQKKLVDVKVAHITELENKMNEMQMMLDAWKNHVTCMEMERDEAIEKLKNLQTGGASSSDGMVRKI